MERDHHSFLLQVGEIASFTLITSQKLLQAFKNQLRTPFHFIRLIVLTLLIVGCGQNKKEEKESSMHAESAQANQKREIIVGDFKSNFTKEEIAKFTIATVMDQKPESLSVEERGGIIYVASKDPEDGKTEDGKTIEYKIRINGNRINWGNVPGRWRTTKKDEKISFEENGDEITIVQTFQDGSKSSKTFSRQE